MRDWQALPAEDRGRVRFLFLQNGDDPIPKFWAPLLWRRPDWLGPDDTRPPGAPRGTHWMPVTTFFMTFLDMQNALAPTPGTFDEGGHDYRNEIPEALRAVWRLDITDEQMSRVQEALRARELRWEVRRGLQDVEGKPTPERDEAEQKLLEKVATWTGRTVDLTAARELAGLSVAEQ